MIHLGIMTVAVVSIQVSIFYSPLSPLLIPVTIVVSVGLLAHIQRHWQ